ncbi:cyanase [Thiopseudomonas denitrificans]|uniref:Cyanate hydratase n=1 Tax=Thiopseudomonas denitrificans TaxID=1501432 RepID=A0A4R6TYB6_9GAMM|nr:cyanase [Thiopseudomonas denitrificans]TDQ37822.1 cyanate lyase [Thiopseudomonas denitrificans]
MNKAAMTEAIILAKNKLQLSWEAIAAHAGLDPVFVTSACLGMNSLQETPAKAIAQFLQLPDEIATALQQYPHKNWDKAVPTDPLVYRLYEIVGVYGDTLKELIHEKFGDGIMSAIDFSMQLDKEENPAGDRVVLTLNGKFLPYKSW